MARDVPAIRELPGQQDTGESHTVDPGPGHGRGVDREIQGARTTAGENRGQSDTDETVRAGDARSEGRSDRLAATAVHEAGDREDRRLPGPRQREGIAERRQLPAHRPEILRVARG